MAAEDLLRRARILADLGRYDQADPVLAQALAEEPDSEEGLWQLSGGLIARGRFSEAEAAARRLLHAHPDSMRGLMRMTRTQLALGGPRVALPFARRAVELYPGSTPVLMNLAIILNEVSRPSAEALALCVRAITIDPDFAMAYQLAASIHLDLRHHAEAERLTLQALRNDPADPWAMIQLGMARAALGRFDESRDDVMAALRAGPSAGTVGQVIEYAESCGIPGHLAEIYGMALAARGQADVSRPGAAGEDPELIAAQGRLAKRMYTRGAGQEAHRRSAELADAVLAVDPHNADARWVRSKELHEAGQFEQAVSIARQLQAEDYPDASKALVLPLLARGEAAAALAVIEGELADNPDSPVYRWLEASALRALKRCDEALRSALRAAKLSPSLPGVQIELGLAAWCTGDRALAERALRAAMADTPGEGYPAAELARLLAESGRWPEAEDLLARLTADLPDVKLLARPCLAIAARALRCAEPSIRAVCVSDPDPGDLEKGAHWLDLILRMCTLAAIHSPAVVAKTLASNSVSKLIATWKAVPAPPDSSFARAARGFDVLLDNRRST
jgi:tetratricopeptide (TPR) repeat protein